MTLSNIIFAAMEIAIVGVFLFFIVRAILSKKGRKLSLALAFLTAVSFFVFPLLVEDMLFFKEDARIKLKEDNIVLHDNFRILSHHVTGMVDLYETFELEISDHDREMIAQLIGGSPYITDPITAENFPNQHLVLSRKIFCDNRDAAGYRRQSYQKLMAGYASDLDRIVIGKFGNRLVFERVNE